MKSCLCFAVLLFLSSCKISPDSNRNYAEEKQLYKLFLNPAEGSKYHYDIRNETVLTVELDGKSIINKNVTTVGINYEIHKDTAGNFILHSTYDNIRLHSQAGDEKTDIDADNASFSVNPVEKLLASLKAAHIFLTISPSGELKASTGYEEIANKVVNDFVANGQMATRIELEKLIRQKVVDKNADEIFKIFPDSAVHIGDEWKLTRSEISDVNLIVKTVYKLKELNNSLAIIDAEGQITSDSTSANFLGYENAASNLKGKQQARYSIETKSGMLYSGKIKASIKGELNLLGRLVDITISRSVDIQGRRVQ